MDRGNGIAPQAALDSTAVLICAIAAVVMLPSAANAAT